MVGFAASKSRGAETLLVSNKRTVTRKRKTKKITILNDVRSLFVLSQCVSCSPGMCFVSRD